MRPRLELRGIDKAFADTVAATGVELSVAPGEFVSLLGPSGCGKSTLLSIIAGLLRQDAGDVFVDGRLVNDVPAQKRGIGLVFQDYAVFSRLTVRDNLAFGLKSTGVRRRQRDERVAKIAERLDLENLLNRRAGSLNMSEMQRVAIARALIVEPELLLLDEPMSNLDAAVRMALRTELKRIQSDLGQTVLYVTHDQEEAMAMSDRIAVMDAGRIVQSGAPEEIYQRPHSRFVASFIGDPPMNLLACTARREAGSVVVRTALHGPFFFPDADSAAGDLVLGIRPHDVRLGQAAPGAVATTVLEVDNLGAEQIVHLRYGEAVVTAAAPPGTARPGDQIAVSLDPTRLHLFFGDDLVLRPGVREIQHA